MTYKSKSIISMLLAVTLLAGCASAGKAGPASTGEKTTSFSLPDSSKSQEKLSAQPGHLRVLLPENQATLSEIIKAVAAEDKIEVTVQTASGQSSYVTQLTHLLETENAPDLFFIQGESDARQVGHGNFKNLLDNDLSPALSALAEMTPQHSRLLDSKMVYGLPVGYFAEGYLLDVELLGMLLGATNTAALQNDLANSSFEQWSMMLSALEVYLQKPASMRLKLGDSYYTTPAYRPKGAQKLRGIFAVTDGSPVIFMQSALTAACFAPYDSPEQWLDTPDEEVKENLFPSLESLYALLDYETMHMARPEGAVYRGEEYAQRQPLTREQAEQIFADGTALVYRSDSRRGMYLEQQFPHLSGRLVLVPVKLPPPVLPQTEEESSSSSKSKSTSKSTSSSKAETSDSQSDSALQEEITKAQQAAAQMEKRNTSFWYGAAGMLALNPASQNQKAAETLLLRLFTTEQGVTTIQKDLHLYPFSQLLPNTPLSTQVSRIVLSDASNYVLVPPESLDETAALIGSYVAENLMSVTEWEEEQAEGFLTHSMKALGYRLQPELEDIPEK